MPNIMNMQALGGMSQNVPIVMPGYVGGGTAANVEFGTTAGPASPRLRRGPAANHRRNYAAIASAARRHYARKRIYNPSVQKLWC